MGLFDGVKGKLGFGGRPEWQDEGVYEDVPGDDGYYYDDGFAPAGEDDYVQMSDDVVSFDAYNPDTFRNVNVSSSREPRVASSAYTGRSTRNSGYSSSGGYASSIGTSAQRRDADSGRPRSSESFGNFGATWETPADPSFLNDPDEGLSARSREVLDQIGATQSGAGDPYTEFDSELRQIHGDPSARLEVVTPKVYGDVEKVATAAKAGKTVVLALTDTKPELAKRILDFSFGVASALNKNVEKAADRVFIISKGDQMLAEDERGYLQKKGVL